MKILHLCLAAFYIDKNSYQENLLPRMHKRMGHEVKIIASTETYVDSKKLGYVSPVEYVNEDGIPIKRIPYIRLIPPKIVHKLRIYKGVYEAISDFAPDFIFMHNFQFLSILEVRKYLSKNPNTKVVVDCHSDKYNSAKSFISYKILHRCLYRLCARIIEPYVSVFWGTLPARVDFLINVYDIPKEKVALLPMGADDDVLRKSLTGNIRNDIRNKYGIKHDDFLIVTGGKINDNRPETLSLFEAVSTINRSNLKLLFFGNVSDKYLEHFNQLCNSQNIINVGWQASEKTCEFMAAADLVVFPGLHSVMWEQAVALGKPCIFRKIPGFEHVDIGGNAIFIDDTSVTAFVRVLDTIAEKNNPKYLEMLSAANNSKKDMFLYSKIAEKSLDI